MLVKGRNNQQRTSTWGYELFEALLGLVFVSVGSWILPQEWFPLQIAFTGFLLLILAIAIRHRSSIAYLLSLLSAMSYVVLLLFNSDPDQSTDILHLLLEPSVLFCAGVIASDILHSQRHRLLFLAKQLEDKQKELKKIIQRYENVLAVNTELEEHIAGQPSSIATLSEQMAQLWKQRDDQCYPILLNIVQQALHAQSCALYLINDTQYQLALKHPKENTHYPEQLNLADPVIARAQQIADVCTIRDLQETEQLTSEQSAVMAGPLLDENGESIAVLVIADIPLLKFTPGAIRQLRAILQMASVVFQHQTSNQQTEQLLFIE